MIRILSPVWSTIAAEPVRCPSKQVLCNASGWVLRKAIIRDLAFSELSLVGSTAPISTNAFLRESVSFPIFSLFFHMRVIALSYFEYR